MRFPSSFGNGLKVRPGSSLPSFLHITMRAIPTSFPGPGSRRREHKRSRLRMHGAAWPRARSGEERRRRHRERLGERLERVERRGPLPALEHRDVRHGEACLGGEGFLGELAAETLALEVHGELVGETGHRATPGWDSGCNCGFRKLDVRYPQIRGIAPLVLVGQTVRVP